MIVEGLAGIRRTRCIPAQVWTGYLVKGRSDSGESGSSALTTRSIWPGHRLLRAILAHVAGVWVCLNNRSVCELIAESYAV